MNKFFLLLIFGVLVYLYIGRNKRARREPPPAPPPVEAMIECAYCHVHLPQSESVVAGERRYCCEEHRRLGQS